MIPRLVFLTLPFVLLTGCASLPPGHNVDERDPWERYNRAIFINSEFNLGKNLSASALFFDSISKFIFFKAFLYLLTATVTGAMTGAFAVWLGHEK